MNTLVTTLQMSLVLLSGCHQRPIPTDQAIPSANRQSEEPVPVVQEDEPIEPASVSIEATEPAPPLFSETLPISTPDVPEGLSSLSAQECNSCHFDTHDSWNGSGHQMAWSQETAALLGTDESIEPICVGCHLPIESQHSTPSQEEGEPSHVWDPTLQQEGVTCAACHVRDGTIYGVHMTENAPHAVTPSSELQSAEFCANCHQLSWPDSDRPIYDTFGEWSRSWYADAGITCQTCHMRPTPGVATAGALGYFSDHSPSIDPSRAITLQISLDAPIAVRGTEFVGSFTITNSGSGHAFPTGSPFKSVLITATLFDGDQEPASDIFSGTLERTVQDGPPWNTLSDSTLAPNESKSWDFRLTPIYGASAGLATLQIDVAIRHSDGRIDRPFTTQSIPVTMR